MKYLHYIAFILVVIGGLNWALLALTGSEIGSWVGGMESTTAKVIYILVGLSAVYLALTHKGDCRACGSTM